MKNWKISHRNPINVAVFVLLFTAILLTGICTAEDLVLHLSFDDLNGKVAKDSSEFGNDATFSGSPKLVDGKFGKAIDFDGKTWAEIPDHDSIDIVDGITIELWANPERRVLSKPVLKKVLLGRRACIPLQHTTEAGQSSNSLICLKIAMTKI